MWIFAKQSTIRNSFIGLNIEPVHEKYAFWPMYFVKYSTNTGLLYCICTFCTFCVLFKTNPGFSFLCNGYFVRPEIGSKVPAFLKNSNILLLRAQKQKHFVVLKKLLSHFLSEVETAWRLIFLASFCDFSRIIGGKTASRLKNFNLLELGGLPKGG